MLAKAWYGRGPWHNARAFTSILIDWSVIALAVVTDQFFNHPLSYVVAVFLIGSRMQALAELEHEALHFNLFTKRNWNESLEVLYALPLFSRVRWYRQSHIGVHHRHWKHYSKFEGYGYEVDTRRLKTSLGYFLFTVFIRPFTLMGSSLLSSVITRAKNRALIDLYPVIAFHAFVLLLLHDIGHMALYLKYWLVPFVTVYAFLYWAICLTAHANVENKLATRDSRGWFIRLFVSPHDFAAYHSMHHEYPGIPWYNLRKANDAIGDQPDAIVNRGVVEMLTSIRSPDTRDPSGLRKDLDMDYLNQDMWRNL